MIKLETHAHSLYGSRCASVPPETLIKEYKAEGYGGAVLTNHYNKHSFDSHPGDSKKEKLDRYFSLVHTLKESGEKQNFKVFFGCEVYALSEEGNFSEYMLYGFEEKLLYDSPLLYLLTQEELFRLAEKNGLFFYQTHPFREGITTGNPEFLHGAEAFNGHVGHVNNNEKALEFCEKNFLIMMSGTDYHDAGQPITGGIYIPENINGERQLSDYIMNNKVKLFCDKEKYKTLCKK